LKYPPARPRTEFFEVHSGMAYAIFTDLDEGRPPSSLYMTRMEQRAVSSQGTAAAVSRPPAYPTLEGHGTTEATTETQPRGQMVPRGILLMVLIAVAAVVPVHVMRSSPFSLEPS